MRYMYGIWKDLVVLIQFINRKYEYSMKYYWEVRDPCNVGNGLLKVYRDFIKKEVGTCLELQRGQEIKGKKRKKIVSIYGNIYGKYLKKVLYRRMNKNLREHYSMRVL